MSRRACFVVVAIAACQRGGLPTGDVVATLNAPPAAGTFDPHSLYGAPTIVAFVSPRCGHCLATIPHLEEATLSEHAHDLLVFVSGNASQAKSAAGYARFTGPVLVDDGTLLARYHVERVPYMLVLAADGRARDSLEGEQETSELRDAIASAR